MKNIAVVLSGSGFQDGTEITEAVSTLVAIGRQGAKYQCFAPNLEFTSKDHLNGAESGQRNTLSESARIARGKVLELKKLNPDDFDAIVFPGGFGAALHLCDWAQKGAQAKVLPDVVRVLQAFHADSKPIGAICIAPALVAKVLGDNQITVTIGNDKETAEEIEKTGAVHEDCPVNDFITDRSNKVVTCPAYMFDEASPFEVSQGIEGLIKEVVEMA